MTNKEAIEDNFVGKRIKEILTDKKLSAAWLSRETNISPNYLRRIINGQHVQVSTLLIARICDAFSISLEEFYAKDYINNPLQTIINISEERRETLKALAHFINSLPE